jgi:predicted aconitase with swiveling domain
MELSGRVLVVGPEVEAPLVFTDHPLSFWGGYDPATGTVVDRHHPLFGVPCAGRVLALPGGRGSSTASGILLESVRAQTAPAALIVSRLDPILVLGLVLAEEVYAKTRLLVQLSPEDFERLRGGVRVAVDAAGRVRVW